jgi:XFP N-terminal domain
VRGTSYTVERGDLTRSLSCTELGYALAVSYGAVMDKPDLIIPTVIGDGELESGPAQASLHGHKVRSRCIFHTPVSADNLLFTSSSSIRANLVQCFRSFTSTGTRSPT